MPTRLTNIEINTEYNRIVVSKAELYNSGLLVFDVADVETDHYSTTERDSIVLPPTAYQQLLTDTHPRL